MGMGALHGVNVIKNPLLSQRVNQNNETHKEKVFVAPMGFEPMT